MANAMAASVQQETNLLFLDLSTKSTGYAVANQQGKLIQYGCLTASSQDVLVRIQKIIDQLKEILKKFNISSIFAEEVRQEHTNNHTEKVLIWLQGAMLLAAREINPKVQYEFIMPNSWRAKIGIKTGRGITRAQLKPLDIKYVKQHYKLDVNDDIADAIGIMDAYFIEKDNVIDFGE